MYLTFIINIRVILVEIEYADEYGKILNVTST